MALIRKPSAFLSIAMSVSALALLAVALAVSGVRHDRDEGAAAHLFQWLMVGQVPIIAFFAIKWLGRDTRAALSILALQALAIGAALLPV
jgi:hypothetical protein